MLEVRLLGSFSLECNGQPVDLPSRKAQSLFSYLILTAGTLHRREKLAGIFWPEASEERARAYLRHELWRVRKALSQYSNIEYVIADDISLSFNRAGDYSLDVLVLQNLDESASDAEWMEALSLYRGELLPGFYEEWITPEREHLQRVFEKNIERLLQRLEASKDWSAILDWAERWIALEHQIEVPYRYMMVAYESLGDRAKLLSTFQRCIAALRELDLEPSEQTKAIISKPATPFKVPIPLTSFIGREQELEEIKGLLERSRFVTLTGAGGTGKTRLAIQLAADVLDRFTDGVWFLDLAPLTDSALVPETLAKVLGLRESGKSPILDVLINYLRSRTALLIFDNCEHLIESCARLIHTLLTSCPNLTILATSRESLRVSGEIPYRVPSLEIPPRDTEFSTAELSNIESVRLFTERASFAALDFVLDSQSAVVVGQICQRLDGIPLAIELAAARVDVLSVQELLKRLDDRFDLLAHGLRSALPRHRTLRAMIEWSYDLLSEKERILFRRLAVFMGGWTLEAAEEVCAGNGVEVQEIMDLLSQLVNKSLVLVETTSVETRYRRLETIRHFARTQFLESAESAMLCDRHLAYFVAKTEQIEPYLMGEEEPRWMDCLDAEFDNIRLALEWSISTRKCEEGFRLFGSLGWFWFIRGHHHEAEQWFRRMVPFRDAVSMDAQAKALRSASFANYIKRDLEAAISLHVESLCCYRELDDSKEISTTLQFLGVLEKERGNLALARSYLEESLTLSRKVNNKLAMPRALIHLAQFLEEEGKISQAWQYYEESLKICREMKEGHVLMVILSSMGHRMLRQNRIAEARQYYGEALEICIQLKNKRTTAEVFLDFANLLSLEERYSESAQLQGFAESLLLESQTLGDDYLSVIRNTALGLKRELGEDVYQNQFIAGKKLNLNQAKQIVLQSK